LQAPLAVTLQAGAGTPDTHTFATDANGNPTGLESSTGVVTPVDRYVYDPYGDLDPDANSALASAAATNPLRFNGFDYDSAVKTYDMQARDYRPSVGRFLQADRYEQAQSDLSLVADPLSQNRYDFVGNDPVTNVEFDGHIPGAGSGCVPRCGDNQGGNMTATPTKGKTQGKSTNYVTPNAAGTSKPTRIKNPAAPQALKGPTKADKQRYANIKAAVKEQVSIDCLEKCSDEEEAHNFNQVAGAFYLGLGPETVDLQALDKQRASAVPDDSLLNPVNLVTDVATGGSGFLVKRAFEAGARKLATAGARRGAAKAASGAESSLQGALLREDLRMTEKYGSGGVRELENGHRRYYGDLRPSRTAGEMGGQRTVREWDPATGAQRTWLETLDQQGRVRIVRPETGGPKTHYYFDQQGGYGGSR
jgi:RHS repeat-associated protein